MPIVVNLDIMMAKRRITSGELAAMIGLTQANLSILKTGKARAIRFSTLEAICEALECQPGDLLEYENGDIETGTKQRKRPGHENDEMEGKKFGE